MVHARHYVVVESGYAVLLVGNSIGRYDSPAGKLYDRIADKLKQEGVSTLRVALGNPESLEASEHEVRTGIQYLCSLGSKTVILVGYDRGAAAVGASASREACVAGLALLSAPTGDVPALPGRSVLIVRGEQDERGTTPESLPEGMVVHVLPGASRTLDEQGEEVCRVLEEWIRSVREDGSARAA